MSLIPLDVRTLWLAVATLLATLATANTSYAHPFHVSVAEVELNREKQVLEVGLRVHPTDLEKALRAQARDQSLTLEKHAGLKADLTKYIQRHFTVRGRTDTKPLTIRWIGEEIDVKWAWLYFEIPLEKRPVDDLRFSNTVFLDLLNDQINTINLRDGKRKASMQFHRKSLTSRVQWKASASSAPSSRVVE